MTKFGQVTLYNEATGVATIEYIRPDACEKCGACGTASSKGSIDLKADCTAGDWVRVEFPESRFLQATALAYAMPLGALLVGLILGYFAGGGSDGWTLAGGLLFLGISLLVLKVNEKRIAGRAEWTPHIAEIYADKPSADAMGCSGAAL